MIDQKRQLFPFCIVWTVIPCISWFIPTIGHTGIGDSDGVIYDFLGYHINIGSLAFGNVIKYVKVYADSEEIYNKAIAIANKKFQDQNHNLCCNNCHHHVAYALNQMNYEGKSNWTQADIWWMCITRSNYVDWCSILKVYLPFLIIVGVILGIVFGIKGPNH